METKQKNLIIWRLINRELQRATEDLIRSKAELGRQEAGEAAWKREDEKEGGLGGWGSPYHPENARKQVTDARNELRTWQELLDYVSEVFITT